MTFWISFAIYTAIMAFVWGFFLIAKMHIYTFRNYSTHIGPVTQFISVLLMVLTIAGYVIIYRGTYAPSAKTQTIEQQSVQEEY